jgi:hypothetical protein
VLRTWVARSSFADAGAGVFFAAGFFPIVIECPKVGSRQVLVLVLVLVLGTRFWSAGAGAGILGLTVELKKQD